LAELTVKPVFFSRALYFARLASSQK